MQTSDVLALYGLQLAFFVEDKGGAQDNCNMPQDNQVNS